MPTKASMKDAKKEHTTHDLILVMGPWKKDIPENQRNIIIATALNDCSYKGYLKVTGYLITNRRVFLILSDTKEVIDQLLELFYKKVALGIHEYEKMISKYTSKEASLLEEHDALFKKYPFYNWYIKKLITGQKIALPYYDPHVAKLEDQIRDYNFCSAIDYSGAKSPVIVKTH